MTLSSDGAAQMRSSILKSHARRSGGCALAILKWSCAFEQQICSFVTSHVFLPAQVRSCTRKSPMSTPSLMRSDTCQSQIHERLQRDGRRATRSNDSSALSSSWQFSFVARVTSPCGSSSSSSTCQNHAHGRHSIHPCFSLCSAFSL